MTQIGIIDRPRHPGITPGCQGRVRRRSAAAEGRRAARGGGAEPAPGPQPGQPEWPGGHPCSDLATVAGRLGDRASGVTQYQVTYWHGDAAATAGVTGPARGPAAGPAPRGWRADNPATRPGGAGWRAGRGPGPVPRPPPEARKSLSRPTLRRHPQSRHWVRVSQPVNTTGRATQAECVVPTLTRPA